MQCDICGKDMWGMTSSSPGPTICGSCVMTPLPTPEQAKDTEKGQRAANFDLSYLNDEKQGTAPATRPEGKTVGQVRVGLQKVVLLEPEPQEVTPMKTLTLKSNSVRDRIHTVGGMNLKFDGDGLAKFPEHMLEAVQEHMKYRPNRFRIIREEEPEPKKDDPQARLEAARAALEAAKAEKVQESPVVVETPPEPSQEPEPAKAVADEPEAPKEEAPEAKRTTKKRTTKKRTRKKRSTKKASTTPAPETSEES